MRPRWAFALYAVLGVAMVGGHVLGHFGSVCACGGTTDASIFLWNLKWWPHAIAHGLNPLFTDVIWAPPGANVAQATGVPLAALLMTPVTETAGALASYNALAIASPVVSGFCAYLLCRYLTQREWPAVAGGYLFGFSPYEFARLTAHLNLTLTFAIPLAVLVFVRRLDGMTSRLRYVAAMAFVIVIQEGLSVELLATAVLLAALLLVIAWASISRARRPELAHTVAETAAAGLLAAVLTAPFLYYVLLKGSGPTLLIPLQKYSIDVLNLVIPTETTLVGGSRFVATTHRFSNGSLTEAGGYLSVALIGAWLAWVIGDRCRSTMARITVAAAAVSLVLAFGSRLTIGQTSTIPLPFALLRHLPVFDLMAPGRFVVFTTLAVAVGIAAWLSEAHDRLPVRWGLVGLGIVLTFPNLQAGFHGVSLRNPALFTSSSTYRRYLRPGENVLVLPYGNGDQSTWWEAETGFYFRMPEGYIATTVPPPFDRLAVVRMMYRGKIPPRRELSAFLVRFHVRAVILDPADRRVAAAWRPQLARMGLRAIQVGGVLLYRAV